ncbi:MAG: putative acetyltransferase and amidohydrolase [Rhodocyclaceae bacterium]|nr:putative acetyltransferase and amidohydrolase [Rhodocyclaceae bacterium]
MIRLRPLRAEDGLAIHGWPAYPPEFNELDYALREEGWIAEFQDQPGTRLYAVEQGDELAALAILAGTGTDEAEFRLALHPERLGRGLGGVVAARVLEVGFGAIGLGRIHLVVRKNNERAIRLYRRLGFVLQGECRQTVNHQATDFFVMDVLRPDWARTCGLTPR